MNIAYIEPLYGISGDMLLAAFLDAGYPLSDLCSHLRCVVGDVFRLEEEVVVEKGVRAKRLKISLQNCNSFRGLKEVEALLFNSSLKERVLKDSFEVIKRLASVEAKIHNLDIGDVHFHELGALDTIIDIVGFFLALDFFKIDKVLVSALPIGNGSFPSSHGFMPIPAFATLELLKGFQLYGLEIEGENITPTAAAIISVCASSSSFPNIVVKNIGYGTGSYSFVNFRNLVRISLGSQSCDASDEDVIVLEFVVDDMSPELLANFMYKVFQEGAKDCFFVPVVGKKGRPSTLVTLIVSPEEKGKFCDIIFYETTTIGVRCNCEKRVVLKREEFKVKTSLGLVSVKRSFYKGMVNLKPEFEDLKRIAGERGLSLKEVYSIIYRELK